MQGFWPIFFLLVVLKIPVLGALWLIWWAARPPEEAYEPSNDESGGPNRWRPLRPRPRGPHSRPGGGAPMERVRTRPAELVSDRRERVPTEGCEPSPSQPSRQTD
jgi:hypothetical protein